MFRLLFSFSKTRRERGTLLSCKENCPAPPMLDKLISTAQNEEKHFSKSRIIAQSLYSPCYRNLVYTIQLDKTREKRKKQKREKERYIPIPENKHFIENEKKEKYEIYTIFKYIFTYVTIWIFFKLSKD